MSYFNQNIRYTQLSSLQFVSHPTNQLSEQLINSSKTLMSTRLIEIQNQILERFEQYPPQQKNMLRQMLYQNIDSLTTLNQKITFLLSLIQNKDLSRLKIYVKQSQSNQRINSHATSLSHNCLPKPYQQGSNHMLTSQKSIPQNKVLNKDSNRITSGLNTNLAFKQGQVSFNNQDKSNNNDRIFVRQCQNPTCHEERSFKNYLSSCTLDTALKNNSSYSSLVNSENSEQLREFRQLQRKKKMEAMQKKASNLIESGKLSQQLKLLRMVKKLSQYQNPIIQKITSVQQIGSQLTSKRFRESSWNHVLMKGVNIEKQSNISMRQRLNDQKKTNFNQQDEEKYQLTDQFSFRQGINNEYNQNIPDITKTYSQKQFRVYSNDAFDQFDQKRFMTHKNSLNDGFQDDFKSRVNFNINQNELSYEDNMKKLVRLRKQKFQKQNNDMIQQKNLDERIQSLFHINSRQRETTNKQIRKDKIQMESNYQTEKEQQQTKINRSIQYTQSDNTEIDTQEELDYQNQPTNINRPKENTRQLYSPHHKNDFFKRKTHENHYFTKALSKPNHSKASDLRSSNKKNKNHSKSSVSRSLSSQSKSKTLKRYSKQAQHKYKNLKRQKTPFEKKFVRVKKDGDLGDFELEPSQFSNYVNEYFLKRKKVIPSLIPSIMFMQERSNQNQLVNRNKLQKARQKEIQQKVCRQSNSLKLLRQRMDEMKF